MNTHSFPLLSTKLHRPPVTGEIVWRKRLHEVMDRALELPLTMVSGRDPAPEKVATALRRSISDQYEQPVRVRLLTRIVDETHSGK
jgi:hypothetical protein